MQAKIVVGLGFGDEGKGLVTDWLCSTALNPIVIRFSGGQQCGHNVVIDGKSHIHSSYGAGTLRGVPSFISEYCSIYLNTLASEKEILNEKGVKPTLFVHPEAYITTPYDVAWNRMTERKNQHGSCGLGVCATKKRNDETGYKLVALDLDHPSMFLEKLEMIKGYYHHKAVEMGYKENAFVREYSKNDVDHRFMALAVAQGNSNHLFRTESYDVFREYGSLIFEGSQGIMLDEKHGIFPNVTYGSTTSKNVYSILSKLPVSLHLTHAPGFYYVTRCYQTRHGNGWMSNHNSPKLINTEYEINVRNEWQGSFKTGEVDYKLLNYALKCDENDKQGSLIKKNLVVTCLDQRPGFSFDYKQLDVDFDSIIGSYSPDSKDVNIIYSKI